MIFTVGLESNAASWLYYINPVFRFLDFLLGMMIYEIYCSVEKKISANFATFLECISCLCLIIFIYGAVKYNISLMYRWDIYYLAPLSFLLFSFSLDKGFLSKVIGNPFFVWLGNISMAFYLFHQIVLVSLGKYYQYKIVNCKVAFMVGLLGFIITVCFSWMVTQLIEKVKEGFVGNRTSI